MTGKRIYNITKKAYHLLSTLKKEAVRLGKKKRNKMKLANGEWKLAGKTNKHHILAKSRHGTYSPANIIRWDINIHKAFHWIFGNRTLEEAADFLRHMNELKLLGIEPDPTWGIQN